MYKNESTICSHILFGTHSRIYSYVLFWHSIWQQKSEEEEDEEEPENLTNFK